jgi:hypothetical protein
MTMPRCRAVDCETKVSDRGHMFCRQHWMLLPTELHRDLRVLRVTGFSTALPSSVLSFLWSWKRAVVRARRYIAVAERNPAVPWLEKVMRSYDVQEDRRSRPPPPLLTEP